MPHDIWPGEERRRDPAERNARAMEKLADAFTKLARDGIKVVGAGGDTAELQKKIVALESQIATMQEQAGEAAARLDASSDRLEDEKKDHA